jgi:hypothetical protein
MNATSPLLVLTPTDLRAALAARGITQQGFARITGRNPRTIRRWCDDRRLAPFDIFTRTFIGVSLDKFDEARAKDHGSGDAPA